MKTLVLILCLAASGALAADIVKYPTSANFEWSMRTDGDVPIVSVGLVDCNFPEPSVENVVARIPIPEPAEGLVIEGTILLDVDGGNVCFRGVGFSALGVMSPLSEDTFQLRLVPAAPVLLSGGEPGAGEPGGVADAGGGGIGDE